MCGFQPRNSISLGIIRAVLVVWGTVGTSDLVGQQSYLPVGLFRQVVRLKERASSK
jgi:hypothetical protein